MRNINKLFIFKRKLKKNETKKKKQNAFQKVNYEINNNNK